MDHHLLLQKRNLQRAACWVVAVCCCLLLPVMAVGQKPGGLFDSEEVLQLTLSGDTRALFKDRGDQPQYHPLLLTYTSKDGSTVSLRLKARTRGHFRKETRNCTYPPILLNFQKAGRASTLFEDQDKTKLVTTCRDEQWVIREYLVYKLYNLLTPKSYRVRLARTTFRDTVKGKETSFFSFLLEEDEQMAKRNGMKILKRQSMGEATETETYLKMAVFQYMIGNTDWSVPYRHNIRLISFDSLTIPSVVPYDFDHAGIVDAPYALPAEELELRSTKERRYRGYCLPEPAAFNEVVATFNRLKADFYGVYANCTLLDQKYVSATTRFLDQFYETINNPQKRDAAFSFPCGRNAPKVVIKGMGKGVSRKADVED